MDLTFEKAEMRKELRTQIAALDPVFRKRSDHFIYENLRELPEYQNAKRVFCYVGVGNEISTKEIIEDMLESGKEVCVPRCLEGGVMEAKIITSLDELLPAPFNLLEPCADAPCAQCGDIDLILLPCISVAKDGRRLGQGGGFYDRYLAESDAVTICLCREILMREELPTEPLDRRVDLIVSDEEVYDNRCGFGGQES